MPDGHNRQRRCAPIASLNQGAGLPAFWIAPARFGADQLDTRSAQRVPSFGQATARFRAVWARPMVGQQGQSGALQFDHLPHHVGGGAVRCRCDPPSPIGHRSKPGW